MSNQIAAMKGWWRCNPCRLVVFSMPGDNMFDCQCGKHIRWEFWAEDNFPTIESDKLKIIFVGGEQPYYFMDQTVPESGSFLNLVFGTDKNPLPEFRDGKYRVISSGILFKNFFEYPHIFVDRVGDPDYSMPFHAVTT